MKNYASPEMLLKVYALNSTISTSIDDYGVVPDDENPVQGDSNIW